MEQIKRITGDSVHLISVSGDRALKLSQISTGGGGGTRPHYQGQTEFTPTQGDVLTLYATSGSNSRSIYVANLIIEEQ